MRAMTAAMALRLVNNEKNFARAIRHQFRIITACVGFRASRHWRH
jgi:hypothetical protein